jgi:hypothetical protein
VSGNRTLGQLSGLFLTSVTENEEEAVLEFEDGTAIKVDLRSEAYHCPEAMVLHREGQPIVVWN